MADAAFPINYPPLRFEGAGLDGEEGERGRDPRARRIVAAAYELLDEAGLEGLTIRAVLARTGLARRAFYECFSGKDDLVLAVFETTIRLAAAHYQDMASRIADPLERLAMVVTSIGLGTASLDIIPGGLADNAKGPGDGGNRRSAALSREHLRLADSRPRELQAALAPLLALIAGQLRDGIVTGQVRACEPERQAALIYNLVSTTVHTELIAEEDQRPDPDRRLRLATELWDFCRRAITA